MRVHVSIGNKSWEVYKIWIEKGSFYYTFSPQQKDFNTKFSYHPFENKKWGSIHTKKNKRGVHSIDQPVMTAKTGWPDFEKLDIVPIDTYGFETKDFFNDDYFWEGLKKDLPKGLSLVFDISNITPAFVLRIFLCKPELLKDNGLIQDKITSGGDKKLLSNKVYNFQEFSINNKKYKFSCIVSLIGMEEL